MHAHNISQTSVPIPGLPPTALTITSYSVMSASAVTVTFATTSPEFT